MIVLWSLLGNHLISLIYDFFFFKSSISPTFLCELYFRVSKYLMMGKFFIKEPELKQKELWN